MSTIGILGGGQLARMLAIAGAPLGQRFLIVDAVEDACAGQVAPLITADWHDRAALDAFARRIDVATFDFENVPADVAHRLTGHTRVFPNPNALAVAQDRLAEKTLFREIGLDTARHMAIDDRADLERALRELGTPAVLKTRRLGYDGKGQFLLQGVEDIDAAWAALGGAPSILEAFIRFQREVSVIAVRSRDGEFRHYPLTRNWHANGVLSISLPLVTGAHELEREAVAHARRLAERLDYVGTFALELFVDGDRLLGNEMAPRVHNSAHWTIEGAVCSQFENHVRAVAGLPLGDTSARGYSVMLNWIGELPDAQAALIEADTHWHDYGKQSRAGRKVGHATLCARDAKALAGRLERVAKRLDCMQQAEPALAALAAQMD
ncbi:MAG: 5-(carboxyamino)imidazole ribonucleotide synthase [Rhodanobacteraceae bacterium]